MALAIVARTNGATRLAPGSLNPRGLHPRRRRPGARHGSGGHLEEPGLAAVRGDRRAGAGVPEPATRRRLAVLVGEKAVWGAVLLYGLHDAAQGRDIDWIGSPDFETVCSLAGVEPEAVIDAYRPERFLRMRRAA